MDHLQVVGVAGIINHHHYNTRTKENDLSLLKLQQPLLFNHLVRPIDIWSAPLPSFSMCTITGWGSTRESEFCLETQLSSATAADPGLKNVLFCRRASSSPSPGGERDRPAP